MENIKYSRNTVGCNIGGEIYIHPELYKYPKLHQSILAHELKHSSGINGRDVLIDVFNDELKGNKKDFYKFVFTHPRTLLGFLPFSIIDDNFVFDLEMFVAWATLIIVGIYVGVNI